MTCAMVVRYESSASADIAARDRGPISCTCGNDRRKLESRIGLFEPSEDFAALPTFERYQL